MNTKNSAIAEKSSHLCLDCKAQIELINQQISTYEIELNKVLAKKNHSPLDSKLKNKLEIDLENLRSQECQFKTMSKFEVGMRVAQNGSTILGTVEGLYLVDSYPRVAVIYDAEKKTKYKRPIQLTIVEDESSYYIWTGENYPKLILRGDKTQKDCTNLEVIENKFISASNMRDTHKECNAAEEDIEIYNRQAIYCKKQYLKLTLDNFPEGTTVKVNDDDSIGVVQAYPDKNPASLQEVKVKLESGTIKQFLPTQISLFEKTETYSDQEAKILDFCSRQPTIEKLLIADIRRNGGTQQRTELNKETVVDYAEAMKRGDRFPPIKLRFDGENYWLTDGFHTTEAAWSIGKKEIEAEVIQGTQRDAILDSVGVNANHGLRRSNADKRRAVTTLLQDQEWGKWSDREIAKHCKVDHKTVGKIRKELTGEIPSDNPKKYTDKYGNKSVMQTQNIGSSVDNESTIPLSCPDKQIVDSNVQASTPVKTLADYKVGQLVRINSDRRDSNLFRYNHTLAVITAVNPSSVQLQIFGLYFNDIIADEIENVEEKQLTLCIPVSPKDYARLCVSFDNKLAVGKAALPTEDHLQKLINSATICESKLF